MMKVRLAWVWVAFSAVVLVGCSGGSQEGEDGSATPSDGGLSAETAPGADGLSAEAVADRYGYIEGTAQLTPVYELVPNYNDVREYTARELLMRECMIDIVEIPITPSLEDPQFFEPRTAQARESEELAAQWGYAMHYPSLVPPADPANSDVARAERERILATAEAQAELTACQEQMWERLPRPPVQQMTAVEAAGWEAADVAPAVLEASAAWRVCMEPAGVIDLPDNPMLMPSESIRQATGVGDIQTSDAAPATQWEKDIAVADMRCRESFWVDRGPLARSGAGRSSWQLGRTSRDSRRRESPTPSGVTTLTL